MKYSLELIINLPVDQVIQLFDSSENLHKWMEGLQSMEHLTGTPGEVGATSKMTFQMGKRSIEMVETITVKDLPHQFAATYDAQGTHNLVSNRFEPVDANTTRYISNQEFWFDGLGMKVVAFLLPGAFKKQTLKHMHAFKRFVESQG